MSNQLMARLPRAGADPAREPALADVSRLWGLVAIEDVSEAGIVGELRVHNRANRPILLVEGEVLLGVKQTRVLNLTILVPVQTTSPCRCRAGGTVRNGRIAEIRTHRNDNGLLPIA
jgi:ARG/rhodanese/phosphatase superfamily protein